MIGTMKKILILMILFAVISCEKEEFEPLEKDKISTEFYGLLRLNFYSKNPLIEKKAKSSKEENIYWNDQYPIQVVSVGSTSSVNIIPCLITGISIYEYDPSKPYYTLLRYLRIDLPFCYEGFSTQEVFYRLLKNGDYNFAFESEDSGKLIIKYQDRDVEYSSIDVDNTSFKINVSDAEKIEPVFGPGPHGNNGLPAAIDATLKFSCLLKNSKGEFLLIEEAEVRGRFYRQYPNGYFWDDW